MTIVVQLVKRMMRKDPARRPFASQVLSYSILQHIDDSVCIDGISEYESSEVYHDDDIE